MKTSKRLKEVASTIDRQKDYNIKEAIEVIKNTSKIKFDESVDIAVKLGVDPRKSDQVIRGSVLVPHGLGKKVKILVFAKGDKAEEAKKAGADFVGAEDMVEKIQKGWLDFDATIATPDMMKIIGRLGKILGTRGLMPNPKTGTVTTDIEKAVTEIKAGKAVYRVDKNGIIHTSVGRVSFEIDSLVENIKAVMDALIKAKPAAVKGAYIKKISISSTMGPGIKIDSSFLQAA